MRGETVGSDGPCLFHSDTASVLRTDALRTAARHEVEQSTLIQRAGSGDRMAAAALHRGFWYFVREFERAIDMHGVLITSSRHILKEKFGADRARRVFTGLYQAVRDMKDEEGSHAFHWKKDARGLGITDLEQSLVVEGVKALVDCSYTRHLPRFFSVLAGTEFIAEELSRYLVSRRAYTALFAGTHWVWGEIHLAPHHHGPSHLEIDLDLARAIAQEEEEKCIFQMAYETICLFGKAADDVNQTYLNS